MFYARRDPSERRNNNIPTAMTRCARPPSPLQPSSSSVSSLSDHDNEELQRLEHAPPFWRNPKTKKILSKQLSMCEIPRDMAWERRRRQILCQERRRNGINNVNSNQSKSNSESTDVVIDRGLTDEDMNELKGCIELGFGFNEELGQRLCPTIPALDLYFAVNRQFSTSPISSPNSNGSSSNLGGHSSSSFGSSPKSDSDSWKICSPGDTPEHVKTKLRHWAQAVACSVRQSS